MRATSTTAATATATARHLGLALRRALVLLVLLVLERRGKWGGCLVCFALLDLIASGLKGRRLRLAQALQQIADALGDLGIWVGRCGQRLLRRFCQLWGFLIARPREPTTQALWPHGDGRRHGGLGRLAKAI